MSYDYTSAKTRYGTHSMPYLWYASGMPYSISAASTEDNCWLELTDHGERSITLSDGIRRFPEWVDLGWSRVTPHPDPEAEDAYLWNDRPRVEERFVGPFVSIRMAVHDGRPEVDEIKVVRRAGDPEIKATTLSDIPLGQIADGATSAVTAFVYWLTQRTPGMDTDAHNRAADEAGEAAVAVRRRRTITDALLREAAAVYNADTTGKPTKAVREHFPTSQRNAARYVALAKERGFITNQEEQS